MLARRLRLGSGLVLFAYVTTHLLNHAFGLISLQAMESARALFTAFWRNPILTLVLYSSLVLHIGLVLWAIYQRRYLRLPAWEIVRLALGLVMPILLLPHIFGTRVLSDVFGVEDSYAYVVGGMWIQEPTSAIVQSVLLLIAWVHGSMGIHYWLKVRPWYPSARPILYALALLVPVLSLLGFAKAGQETLAMSATPGWMERVFGPVRPEDEHTALGWGNLAVGVFVAAVTLTFVGRLVRARWQRRKGVVRLTYPGGRQVVIAPGTTVLEASRAAGIPHASVCGGRGRCSTCRSRLSGLLRLLPKPSPDEERVLKRVGAPPNVRLACQLRPNTDLEVIPLLPPTAGPAEGFLRPSYLAGTEQEIAILFADIRSFTTFSEQRLPYDVVFVLNRYFKAMGEAIQRSGGHLDKFIGDGVMALFGVNSGADRGCREALVAAVAMAHGLDELNETLENELSEPLRIGIGIHMGHAIVGEMGHGRATSLTAIGDAVNTASRLESLNKEHKSQVIVSEDVATRAGVDLSDFPRAEVDVRGRTTALAVRIIANAADLEPILEARSEPVGSRQ